jgi:hypothetical protein
MWPCALSVAMSPPAASGPWPAAGLFEFGQQFQSPQCVVPHALEYASQRPERFRARAIKAMLVLGARLDEPGLGERPQLQRDRPEGNVRHRLVNSAGGEFAIPDEPQDLPTARGRHSGQDG